MLIQKPRLPVREILLFGFLPCWLKRICYRLRGYRIGKNVHLGFGTVICGEKVTIGDHVSIGFFTIIRGKQISIGPHVSIGSITFLDTPFIEIGDDSKINEQVFVGGLQYPDSSIKIGRNCQIMQNTFINPATSIVIGDDSGIGGDSLLFGHTSWLSQFEGYNVDFSSIEIGKSVSIAWRVFVLPGTVIGDGSVIGANSLVHRTIPARSLAVGFPARVVSKPPDFPKALSAEDKAALLENIMDDMTTYFAGSGLQCDPQGYTYTIRHETRRLWQRRVATWRLVVSYGNAPQEDAGHALPACDVYLSLTALPEKHKQHFSANRTVWIDIENKERSVYGNDLGEEVILFLKRYGVRLFRSAI